MKVYTSYYALNASHPRAVGISISMPKGVTIRQIKALAPDWETLQKYKQTNDWDAYTHEYLDKLNKLGIENITRLIHDGDVLLCYEKPPKNCHRHLLADWLRNYGIEVEEIERSS